MPTRIGRLKGIQCILGIVGSATRNPWTQFPSLNSKPINWNPTRRPVLRSLFFRAFSNLAQKLAQIIHWKIPRMEFKVGVVWSWLVSLRGIGRSGTFKPSQPSSTMATSLTTTTCHPSKCLDYLSIKILSWQNPSPRRPSPQPPLSSSTPTPPPSSTPCVSAIFWNIWMGTRIWGWWFRRA